MFGVDEQGNDVLAPQFSKNPNASRGRVIKPGSSLDLQMSYTGLYSALSKNPVTQQKAIKGALKHLYEKGKIHLDQAQLEAIRQRKIKKHLDYLKERDQEGETYRSTMAARHSPTVSGERLLSESLLEQKMASYKEKKNKARLEKEIATSHPDVITEALKEAYQQGELADLKDDIEKTADEIIKSIALRRAREGVEQQMVMASRSAIQSIGTG